MIKILKRLFKRKPKRHYIDIALTSSDYDEILEAAIDHVKGDRND